MKDTLEMGYKSVTQIPYFEGDFWPNVLEDCVKDLDDDDIVIDKRCRDIPSILDDDDMDADDVPSKSKGDQVC
jgi:E1A/CREB-binding protein